MEGLAEMLIMWLGSIRMSRTQLVAVIALGWVLILVLWAAGIVP